MPDYGFTEQLEQRAEAHRDISIPVMSPRYPKEVLRCFNCGGDCSNGYEERHEADVDGSYCGTEYVCAACLKEERR